MKVGPVSKLEKRNTAILKKILTMALYQNCVVIVILWIYGQFGAIRKSGSGRKVYKNYIFINSNLLSYKNWKQNYRISNAALILILWVNVLFFTKNADFLQRNLTSSKFRGSAYEKVYVLKPHMCLYLSTKFKVWSLILKSFRQGA